MSPKRKRGLLLRAWRARDVSARAGRQPGSSNVRARADSVGHRAEALVRARVQELDNPVGPVRAARVGVAASLREAEAAAQRGSPAVDVASAVPRSVAQAWV